jgi:thiamine-monophosphate kinase
MALAVSSDMLVAGHHFFPDDEPAGLGHKALAVNLSDLAAMGARPRWATLALALPAADEAWLASFSTGFFSLAQSHGVDLVGGDTTRGPLNLCVTIFGEVPLAGALRRDAARPGDDIWVSGTLGGAALGLQHRLGQVDLPSVVAAECLQRLHHPVPRVALGLALQGVARAAIDISDGLLADLGHILERSGCGAEIDLAALPAESGLDRADALHRRCLLAGGDDYELCFTAAPAQAGAVQAAGRAAGVPVCAIGRVTAGGGLVLRDETGAVLETEMRGYDHFA